MPVPIDPETLTVEHVLPQRIGRTSPWRDLFNDAQHPYYAGSLGNLILVGPNTNRAVRNYEFDRKRAIYANDQTMQSLPLNEGVLAAAQFGPAQIEAREQRLIACLRALLGLTVALDRRPPP